MNLDLLLKPQQIEYVSSQLRKFKDQTFGEFLDFLVEEEKLDILRSLNVNDILKIKDLRIQVDEEVSNIEEYKSKIEEFLSENKLGKPPHNRGATTPEILEEIGGNPLSLRKALSSLKEEKRVFDTGKTQGQRWVLWQYKEQAEKAYLKKG